MVALKNETDFKNNPYLFLMLGPVCNMACRHCSQNPYKRKEFLNDTISDDVRTLIDSYIAYYKKKENFPWTAKVLFWGGEALLHWNLIRELVPYYSKKHKMLENNNVRFVVASNGILLTDEMVDFFNKYNVQFNLSFDAPYPFAVRGKVSEEMVQKACKIDRLVILDSLNAWNCDLYAALRCMREKFVKYAYKLHHNFQLFYTSDIPQDILNFDFDKVRKGIKMCRIAIQLGDKYYGQCIMPTVSMLKYKQNKTLMEETFLRHCVPGRKYLTVTLDGRMVRCHNDDSVVVGTVNDSLDTIYQNSLKICQEIQGKNQTEKCRICEHNDICPGGCLLSLRDENNCYRSCDLYVKPIFSILKEEILQLANPLTEEDKKWFYQNKPTYDTLVKNYVNGIYENTKN